MLKQWQKSECPSDEELKNRLTEARKKLELQQMEVKEHKLPVLVLVEGWGTAGKGSVIGQVIRNIDPRFFKVVSMDTPTPEELRKPFLARYFANIPEAGKFEFLDSGWMDEVMKELLDGGYPPETPVAACYKLTWKEQRIYRGQLKDLAKILKENNLTLTTMIVVGEAIDNREGLSKLYDGHFTHLFRKASK